MSGGVVLGITAVTIVAREFGEILNTAGKIAQGCGQLSSRRQVTAYAIGLLDGERLGGLPPLRQFERLVRRSGSRSGLFLHQQKMLATSTRRFGDSGPYPADEPKHEHDQNPAPKEHLSILNSMRS